MGVLCLSIVTLSASSVDFSPCLESSEIPESNCQGLDFFPFTFPSVHILREPFQWPRVNSRSLRHCSCTPGKACNLDTLLHPTLTQASDLDRNQIRQPMPALYPSMPLPYISFQVCAGKAECLLTQTLSRAMSSTTAPMAPVSLASRSLVTSIAGS